MGEPDLGAGFSFFQRLSVTSGKEAILAQVSSQTILSPLTPQTRLRLVPWSGKNTGFGDRQPSQAALLAPLGKSLHLDEPQFPHLKMGQPGYGLRVGLHLAQSLKGIAVHCLLPTPGLAPLEPSSCGWMREAVAKSHIPKSFLSLSQLKCARGCASGRYNDDAHCRNKKAEVYRRGDLSQPHSWCMALSQLPRSPASHSLPLPAHYPPERRDSLEPTQGLGQGSHILGVCGGRK